MMLNLGQPCWKQRVRNTQQEQPSVYTTYNPVNNKLGLTKTIIKHFL